MRCALNVTVQRAKSGLKRAFWADMEGLLCSSSSSVSAKVIDRSYTIVGDCGLSKPAIAQHNGVYIHQLVPVYI